MKYVPIIAIVSCIALGQYFWISETDSAYQMSLNIQLFVAFMLAFSFISYGRLMEKSAIFIFALSYLWDSLAILLPNTAYVVAANVLVFGSWLMWAYFRSYQLKSSTILADRAYFISGKPKNIGSFYLSLFGDPTGSKGVYLNGKLYGYHRGKFIARTLDADKLNVLADEIKNTSGLEAYLITMVDDKYSWKNNCLTLRLKVWWHLCQTK